MELPDETEKSAADLPPNSPEEEARSEARGGDVSPPEGEAPVRDMGSLAIGGAIGGLVAAKALKGAIGAGAKSLGPAAAGYLAKRLRESREAEAAQSAEANPGQGLPATLPVPPPAKSPVQPALAPMQSVPPPAESPVQPELAPTLNPEAAVPPPLPIPISLPQAPTVSNELPAASEIPDSNTDQTGDVDELLEASAESALPIPDLERDVEAEAREAENELEEALVLMGDGASAEELAPDDLAAGPDRQGALIDDEVDAVEKSAPSPTPSSPPTGAVRSPFMRDHGGGAPAKPRQESKPGESSGGGVEGGAHPPVSPAEEPAAVGVAASALPASAPEVPAQPLPSPVSAAPPTTQGLPIVTENLQTGAPLGSPLGEPALPPAGDTLFPSAEPPAPAPAPVAPAAPSSLPELPPVPSKEPIAKLPGISPPTELPPPASHLPAPRKPLAEVEETEFETDQVSPALVSPVLAGSEAQLTELPFQQVPVPQEKPLPPAAPLTDMASAPRPTLTAAEVAARERANKLAKKKEAKGNGKTREKSPKPKKKKQPKAKAKAKGKAKGKTATQAQSSGSKPKPARKGTKRRLLLVGVPMLAVLGGAGTFAYLNKEKLGIGGGDAKPETPSDVASSGTQPGGSASDGPKLPDKIFDEPGHTLPGAGDPPIGWPVGGEPDALEEPPPAIQFTDNELKEILKDPKRTLEAFLLSGTVEDLLNFVADRELVEPEIRAYYKNGKRTPIGAQNIRFDSGGKIPDTDFSAYQYWVTSLRREIPVSVEETVGGYRVDWAAFTQFHDARLEKFLRNPKTPGGDFYVQLRRSHYFGNAVPDLDDLHDFRVQSPIAPFADAFVFLKKSNPKAKAILERYRWSTGYRPFVTLRWEALADGEPRIELVEIVRHKWRR